MAQKSRKDLQIESVPKNTRQGDGRNTKHSATSRNAARKKYRGQGRQIIQLNPTIPVITPKGNGWAFFWLKE